jgi:hypothetical protein
MTKLNRGGEINNKFLTMDIETFIKDGIHIPYCICFYDGIKTFSYYLTDFKNSNEMIIMAISDLMIKKYDNYKIYIHNLSGFDAIFLLKILTSLGVCNPIIHHDRIISIGFTLNGYIVQFRDSQQLLIASLAKLSISFGVETPKTIFPYTFANENNLNYIGEVPEIKFFDALSYEGYNTYSNIFNNKA